MLAEPAEVILGLIRDAIPGVRVYDGMPVSDLDDRPDRYVIAYIENPVATAGGADGRSVGRFLSWQTSVFANATNTSEVGLQARRARVVAARVRDHLVEHRLARHGGLIAHVGSSWAAPEEPIISRTAVAVHDQYEARY